MRERLLILFSLLPFAALAVADEKPNIVIVMADDLGWGDPRCYQEDSKIPTPAMDRMAREGLRFTDAHTPSSVCTPTRYTLLTGRYAWRTRLKASVLDGFGPPLIEKNRDTLASMLKRAGYSTHCVGKWHLGLQWTRKDGSLFEDRDRSKGFRKGDDVDFSIPFAGGPTEVGFDTFFGISASLDMSPYCFLRDSSAVEIPTVDVPMNRDGMFMNQSAGVTTDSFELAEVLPRIAEEAASIIRRSAKLGQPFFCYVPLTSPHLPVVPTAESRGKSRAGSYGDFVVDTDNALGEILGAIEESGQADNTLVVFTSDNGGLFHWWDFRAADDGGAAPKTDRGEENRRHGHQSNADWRGTKADIYEGGHRVPFLLRWPEKADAGKTIDAIVELTDLFATIADIVKEKPTGDSAMDSFSMLPLIEGREKGVRPFSVHHSINGTFALRRGDWKLVDGRGSGGFTKPRTIDGSDPAGQLYNLRSDAQETTNRYSEERSKVSELQEILNRVKAEDGRATAEHLPLEPVTSALEASAPDGFSVDLIASEPQVEQPIAMAWDHQGRLWVAECRTYSDRGENYDLSQKDRIIVLSDEDKNGSFEKRTVFADNLSRLTSVAVGFGGVWALTSPTMIFIPDADGDLVPDGPAVVKLDGFEVERTRHTIVNGLKWGPDGWLYGRHGIQTTSEIGVPSVPSKDRLRMETGIWRYHPQSEKVEAWTRGGTNPWGHDWNAEGDLFYINTVIGHFWHGLPNAYTKRMSRDHERKYLYDLLPMHADHWHFDINGDWRNTRKDVDAEDAYGGGHAHTGLLIYQADKWPDEYRGDVFTLNFHGRRLNREALERKGGGYVARHKPDFVKFADKWFRGIDLGQGPDGDVYVLDWSDTGECHDNDAIDRSSGRIFRIRYGMEKAGPSEEPDTFEALDIWLRDPNVWYARQARLIVQERRVRDALPRDWIGGLRARLGAEEDPTLALRYFSALHAAEALNPEDYIADEREALRVQSIYLLRDREALSERALREITRLAGSGSTRTRLAITSLLPRLKDAQQWPIAERLVSHGMDAGDHNYPLMVWYAIEPLIAKANESAVRRMFDACAIPQLQSYVIRRLGERYDDNRNIISELILSKPARINASLSGLADALAGSRTETLIPQWDEIVRIAGATDIVNRLGVVFGDERAIDRLIALANNLEANPEARRTAVERVAKLDIPGMQQRLLGWLEDDQLAGVTAVALSRFSDLQIGRQVIERLPDLEAEKQREIVDAIASRPAWATVLLRKIADGYFDRGIIDPIQARRIASYENEELRTLLFSQWGEFNPVGGDEEKTERVKRLQLTMTPGFFADADFKSGKEIFLSRCAACHRLFGQGGDIGPDLTGSGRKDLNYLLENIFYPSAIVPPGYKLSTVKMKDGRTLSGMILSRDEKALSLRTLGSNKPAHYPLSEIASVETIDQSVMPPELLKDLDRIQLRDLFGYLMGD